MAARKYAGNAGVLRFAQDIKLGYGERMSRTLLAIMVVIALFTVAAVINREFLD